MSVGYWDGQRWRTYPPIWSRAQRRAIVRELAEVNGWGCSYCEKVLDERTAQIDHMVARSKGGSDDMSNLTLACSTCNQSKGERSADEYRDLKRQWYEESKRLAPEPVSPEFQAVIDLLSGKSLNADVEPEQGSAGRRT